MISIKVPPLGESIVEATVARWLKKEGESVAQGETLVELETDKITVEVSAFKAGVLARIAKPEGEVVKVDEEIGQLDDAATGAAAGAGTQATPAAQTQAAGQSAATAQAAGGAGGTGGTATAAPPAAGADAKTSPAVRRIAAEENIDVGQVPASGRGGRVTKADMVNAVEARGGQQAGQGGAQAGAQPGAQQPAVTYGGPPPKNESTPAAAGASNQNAAPPSKTPQPAPAAPRADGQRETREKLSTRRRRIAEHLLEAQHATAHLTTFNEVDMSAVTALKDRLKERVEKEHSVKLTFMPFFMKAAVMALKSYPVVNSQLDGDAIVYKHYVNLGIAVASDQGLVVPVLRDADAKGMVQLSRELSAVAKRARDGKLTMDDLTGGTFTITNGGVFGSLVSTPILNYPQVGILGLHKIQDRPVAVGGQVVVRPMMYIALSYDHRIVDGQQAVLFLVRVKELMEDPAAMLVE